MKNRHHISGKPPTRRVRKRISQGVYETSRGIIRTGWSIDDLPMLIDVLTRR